jgi:hypothetical protein
MVTSSVSVRTESPQQSRVVAEAQQAQARIAQLQREVVSAPNSRTAYRKLLEAGLALFDSPGYSIPSDAREDIIDLKLVMEDMFTLQQTISDMGPPWPAALGLDANQLVDRLRSRTVAPAHRRVTPLMDPWGTPYRFLVDSATGVYKVVSAGSDRVFDSTNLQWAAQEQESWAPVRTHSMSDDIVFIDGKNFARIYDYPKDAQTFLYTRCQPADELEPERVRCW